MKNFTVHILHANTNIALDMKGESVEALAALIGEAMCENGNTLALKTNDGIFCVVKSTINSWLITELVEPPLPDAKPEGELCQH